MRYKAFISYSHSDGAKIAIALQSALERFAKPWYRMKSFRIFRDTTNLSLASELWPEIEKALQNAEYLLLLASPSAAQSKWVKREITYWLQNKDPSKLLIILTAGSVSWDDVSEDIDWERTTSIPRLSRRLFTQEPMYRDFTQLQAENCSLDDSEFLEHIATIAARLHDKEKDEIFGEHIRQHCKTMRLAGSAIVALLLLGTAAMWQYGVAEARRELAERQARIATAQRLATQSRLDIDEHPQRSMLLASEALRLTESRGEARVPSAEEALRESLAVIGGHGLGRHPPDLVRVAPEKRCSISPLGGLGYPLGIHNAETSMDPGSRFFLTVGKAPANRLVAVSSNGGWLLTMGDNHTARLWDLTADDPRATVQIIRDEEPIISARFSPDDRWLITGGWSAELRKEGSGRGSFNPYNCETDSGQQTVRIRDLTKKSAVSAPVVLRGHSKHIDALIVSQDGRALVTGSLDGTARIWDLHTQSPAISSAVFSGHRGPIYAVALSKDEQRLVTGSETERPGFGICRQKIPAHPQLISLATKVTYPCSHSRPMVNSS